jgi:hypothetical protein
MVEGISPGRRRFPSGAVARSQLNSIQEQHCSMSHIVTVETQVRDAQAVAAACRRLGLPAPEQGVARLFAGEARGLLVRLPGWRYPLAIDTDRGTLRYDNYAGTWGDPAELGRFQQMYAVEKARIEAHRRGHAVREQSLADGTIKLTVAVGGGA